MSIDRFAILRVSLTGIKRSIKAKIANEEEWVCPKKGCPADEIGYPGEGWCPRCGKKLVKKKTTYRTVALNARSIVEGMTPEGDELTKADPKFSKKTERFVGLSTSFHEDDETIGFYLGESEGGVCHIYGDIYKRAEAWMKKNMSCIAEVAAVMGTTGKLGYVIQLILDESN